MSDSEEDTELKDQGKLRVDVSIDDNNPVQFVIKTSTAFVKVFDMFCAKQNLDVDKTRFLQDGEAIKATQPGENGVMIRTTPKMMGWEAGKSYALEAHTEAPVIELINRSEDDNYEREDHDGILHRDDQSLV